MRFLVNIALLGAFIYPSAPCGATDYYFGTYGPIMLDTDSSKALIQPTGGVVLDDLESTLGAFERIIAILDNNEPTDRFVVCSLSVSSGYLAFLDSIQSLSTVDFAEPYYTLQDGPPLYIGQSFCVAFDSTTSSEEIDSINAIYGVTIQRELEGMPNVFVLLNSTSSGYRTLDLANVYHGFFEVHYSHPNFGFRPQLDAYKLFDYYNEYQFHTKKVVDCFSGTVVWDFAGSQFHRALSGR